MPKRYARGTGWLSRAAPEPESVCNRVANGLSARMGQSNAEPYLDADYAYA